MLRKVMRAGLFFAASLGVVGWASVAQDLQDPKELGATIYGQSAPSASIPSSRKADSPKLDADGYWRVDFSTLASFTYGHPRGPKVDEFWKPRTGRLALLQPDESNIIDPPTEPGTGGTIPDEVVALDGKRVRLGGYMLPVKLEDGLARQFLILRSQMMCCFGIPPAPNEWVVVKMKGKGVPSRMDTPLYFYGTLHVGDIFENKVFAGLYELDVEKVTDH